MNGIAKLIAQDPLCQLVQPENLVGLVYSINYDEASVLSNDIFKAHARGVPNNAFLVASTFTPETFAATPPEEREVLLLRVVGALPLPDDQDIIQAKIEKFQSRTAPDDTRRFDDFLQARAQSHGLKCKILGSFYSTEKGVLRLGGDNESFFSAARLDVYRPRGTALETIVNYVDPLQAQKAREELLKLGITVELAPFPMGTVRYTSTDRLHRGPGEPLVPFRIHPADFLARRTAIFGMTRKGKSNSVKQLVKVIKRIANQSGAKIGQIIFDIAGEYANANQQDEGSIAEVYPSDTVRYRLAVAGTVPPGFTDLRNNFYEHLQEGFQVIRNTLRESGHDLQAQDWVSFLDTPTDEFIEPDAANRSAHNRWEVTMALYKTLLHAAGFDTPASMRIRFPAGKAVVDHVNQAAAALLASATAQGSSAPANEQDAFQLARGLGWPLDPNRGLAPREAHGWFAIARLEAANLQSSSGNPWFSDRDIPMLNVMASRNSGQKPIKNLKNIMTEPRAYHSPVGQDHVERRIYEHLQDGKIVILDLSVGDPTLKQRFSDTVAQYIFTRSSRAFTEGVAPPNIVLYIEEAHNLIGKNEDPDHLWPRIAKEGAKHRLALVYATQEVSSMSPNILANTENWFVTHLNSEDEIRKLSGFYDFADFAASIKRAQDVGFARVKTLSGPFVLPIQLDKFEPVPDEPASPVPLDDVER